MPKKILLIEDDPVIKTGRDSDYSYYNLLII